MEKEKKKNKFGGKGCRFIVGERGWKRNEGINNEFFMEA